ncbi:uncharacterized protein LOC132639541 [Lycium barbarum]|uniref:uncharacterized protein LOC132639541 n=1 Tax=Lycium barbarum TaxID=112863 RepID=UPI00293F00DD|nr:uncharacterized protein LOC132639541 [Lycium barbarum]
MVTHEQNVVLCSYPSKDEVKRAVFALGGDSASGPGGFTGLFYQQYWEIVGNDVHAVVLAFFDGKELPKSITHTNLVLIPKKQTVETFSDMRPISFVKGRSIFENILLTQEIVSDIIIRGKPANVVIKLDMAKVYDGVSWKYLMHVLRKTERAKYTPVL